MVKGLELIFHQKRQKNGKEVYEKMPETTNHQGSAHENLLEDIIKKM